MVSRISENRWPAIERLKQVVLMRFLGPGRFSLLLLLALLGLTACAAPSQYSREPGGKAKTFYLVSHGWHAGIVVRNADIPESVWPQKSDFADAIFLEAGWGDASFYRAKSPSIGTALKAALLPTESVLHIAGFNVPVSQFFLHNRIVALQTDSSGFEMLCAFIAETYAMDKDGTPVVLGEGLYGKSRFYRSGKSYILCSNCNVWAATALQKAGVPITPLLTLTVESLMRQAAKFGTVIQE